MHNIVNGLVNYLLLVYLAMPCLQSRTDKMLYKIVHGCRLCLPIDIAV